MNKITFCINTAKNEKFYLKLLLESLLNGININLHDILIFIDSDNQNTTEMLINIKKEFPNLTIIKNNGIPIGYAGNINYMFQKAKTDVVSYLQSDMIVCLDYDKKITNQLKDNHILCSTRCEPPLHCSNDNNITFIRSFGYTPAEFQYENFLKFAESNKDPHKLTNYFFAPFTLYKKLWNNIGGHDVNFKKSREDSDIALRFAIKGYELKQTWDAIVYHFTCTSSRGIEWWKPENQNKEKERIKFDKIELERFIKKWGTFLHPTCPEEVEPFIKQCPTWRDKIIVTNPPIDESNLIFL
ncbi:MAG TPA: glycosyltransferase family 2 protein [Bacteroidales bacterium]|jgi:GT2 family glycosyltransferase|nr:glycosyltransferase family 2 protein [Bacteroidales bacterium]